MQMKSFKESLSLEERTTEASRIREKYTDRIPVICEKSQKSDIADIDKKKYLVPEDLTVGQFIFVIRKRINMTSDQAIFLFVNSEVPSPLTLMSDLYRKHKDEDGFLYIVYSGENTFGGSSL